MLKDECATNQNVCDDKKNYETKLGKNYFEDILFAEKDFENGDIKPDVVLSKFQDIAVKNAKSLGIGFENMIKHNLLWVTLRIKYQIFSVPKASQTYRLETMPQSKNVLEFDRDYLVLDGDGKQVIRGTSKWCLIDTEKRRIVRIPDFEYHSFFKFNVYSFIKFRSI